MSPVQVVWFKRDLRVRDHWPLREACGSGPVLALYCFEPSQWGQPDADRRHLHFIEDSLTELEHDLDRLGLRLQRWTGEMVDALQAIRAIAPVAGLWSHEETGHLASFSRDKAVAAWCRAHGTTWTELPQFGVRRRLDSRDRWDAVWEAHMGAAVAPPPGAALDAGITLAMSGDVASRVTTVGSTGLRSEIGMAADLDPGLRQIGGRRRGVAILSDFLGGRAAAYRGGISSPLKAPTACSRLSPYLAWGNLSMREVVGATRRRHAELADGIGLDEADRPGGQISHDGRALANRLAASLRAFESRLHWHCHFIQKLESQPDLELRNMHPGYDGLREDDFDPLRFDAWRRGETGYPLIDACMRMLAATGWLNFRMRAMLMSFAAYHLWLHWREPGLHLARLFVDYEPGIHWPQVQMQSGVTGINALRIYDPVKQALAHDPQGRFVRHWLPALRRVPDMWLFEPWRMPRSRQQDVGCMIGRDYPPPIVDLADSGRFARARYAEWRKRPGLSEQARAVFERHGSRKRASERSRTASKTRRAAAATSGQLALFGAEKESA